MIVHDTEDVRACVIKASHPDYFHDYRDPRETYDVVLKSLSEDGRGLDPNGRDVVRQMFCIVDVGDRPALLNWVNRILIRADELSQTLANPFNSSAFPKWASKTPRWPIVLVLGVESPTTVKVSVPDANRDPLPAPGPGRRASHRGDRLRASDVHTPRKAARRRLARDNAGPRGKHRREARVAVLQRLASGHQGDHRFRRRER
jgi:hypothetical protein